MDLDLNISIGKQLSRGSLPAIIRPPFGEDAMRIDVVAPKTASPKDEAYETPGDPPAYDGGDGKRVRRSRSR